MPTDKQQPIALTPDDLKELLTSMTSAAIAEAKKPVVTEADQRQIAQDQQTRAEMAQQQIDMLHTKRVTQRTCTHKHRKGDSHCTFITDDLGGYVLCQKCQAVVRPGVAPVSYGGSTIFDTDLFNRLFQESGAGNGVWD